MNATLVSSIPASLFVTACHAVFDPRSQSLRHASSGHPHPLHWDCAADVVRELESYGLPLGLAARSSYEDRHTRLAPGDVVVLFTDGIVEARGAGGQMCGFDRVASDVLRAARRPGTAQTRLDALLDGMATFLRRAGADGGSGAGRALEGLALEDVVTVVTLAVTQPARWAIGR